MNSNILDINRFSKYFLYDLKNLWNNFGLSLIIISLVPVWVYLFRYLLSLLFGYDMGEGNNIPFVTYEIASAVVVMVFGTKVYGNLTRKDACSSWIMIPASKFEKFASLMVMNCVVAPVAFIAVFGLCDLLLGMLPGYGVSAFVKMGNLSNMVEIFNFSPCGLAAAEWGNWCINILAFTLGAMVFKKGKISNTLLILLGLVMAFGLILIAIAGKASFTANDISQLLDNMTPEKVSLWINLLLNLFYLAAIGLLSFGIYMRIKHIQA